MRPFQVQEYEALPVEEKLDSEEPGVPVKPPRRNPTLVAFTISLVFLVSLVVVLGTVKAWTALTDTESIMDNPEALLAHAARATGDQYLLGVGKADITGYEISESPFGFCN